MWALLRCGPILKGAGEMTGTYMELVYLYLWATGVVAVTLRFLPFKALYGSATIRGRRVAHHYWLTY